MSTHDAAIEPGTYRMRSSAWSVADFTVIFPDHWTVQYGHVFAKHQDEDAELGFYPVLVDEIFTDACEGEGEAVTVGPAVDDLVDALREQVGPDVTEMLETRLGGYPATRLDLEVPPGLDLETCRLFENGVEGLQVWYSAPADKYFVLLPDAVASVYIIDVEGERQVFLVQVGSAATDDDRAELQAVLDSVRIHP
jgi:hypothetical protein